MTQNERWLFRKKDTRRDRHQAPARLLRLHSSDRPDGPDRAAKQVTGAFMFTSIHLSEGLRAEVKEG
jgi:hypothetical protein